VALGVAVAGAITAVDVRHGEPDVLIGTVVLAPFLVAMLGGVRETAVVAVAVAALVVISPLWDHNFGEVGYLLRVAVVFVGGGVSVLAALGRARSRRTEERFALLTAMAEVIDGSSGLQETVERVGTLVVPDFADLCVLDLVTGGEMRRLVVRASGPRAAAIEAALLRGRPLRDAAGVELAETAMRGEERLFEDVPPLMLPEAARDRDDGVLLASLRPRSCIVMPLRARGRQLGAMKLFVLAGSRRRYAQDDARFARVLAGRAALALDSAGLNLELAELERQLEIALGGLAEAVTVMDGEGRQVYANPAAVELLGLESAEELYAARPGEIMERFDVYDESGRPMSYQDLPAARLLAGETDVEPVVVRNVAKETGAERWLVNKISPVVDPDGRVLRVVNVIEDVTDIKRAERDSRLLAEVSQALGSSLDYEETLQRVAELAVPDLADWCALTVLDETGYLRQVAVAHSDPERVALARRLRDRYPERADGQSGPALVIREGRSQWGNEIPDEALVEAAHDEEHLEILRRLGLRAAMVVPIAVGDRALGALTLVSAETGRTFTEADVLLAEELGRRAGAGVANARIYTERSAIAAALQRGLRPPELASLPGWSTSTLYLPAGELNEVGGDFYELFEAPGGFMVVIGDVVGQGAEAATLTALARFTLRTAGELTGDPVTAAVKLNEALVSEAELSLCTALCGHVAVRDDGGAELQIVNCGHPLPLLISDDSVIEVGEYGTMAGAFPDETWNTARVELRAGDTLVLYTDGVTDTVGDRDRFEQARLMRCLAEGPPEPDELVDNLARTLTAFARGPQRDDTAVLALRFAGVPVRPLG
jgi:PAS domain S-box-containing protein